MPTTVAISVVIPAYNAAATITETLASLTAAQGTLERCPLDIVVVDDASTDGGTSDIVHANFGCNPQVRKHAHQRNRSGAAARTIAVEHACHDWLYGLADNLLDGESFRWVVEMAATGDCDVVAPLRRVPRHVLTPLSGPPSRTTSATATRGVPSRQRRSSCRTSVGSPTRTGAVYSEAMNC